jgi:hypothetical protein
MEREKVARTVTKSKRHQAMSLANGVRGEIKAAQKLRMPGWGVVCVIIASFLCAQLFEHFGKLELVLPILNSILVLGFVFGFKRKLWRHAWFWGTMAVIAALHVPLILFVPWTNRWVPAMAIAGIDSLDFCLILWILAVVGKLMREPKAAELRAANTEKHESTSGLKTDS